MSNEQYVLNHYKKLAKNFSERGELSMRDREVRESELKFIKEEVYLYKEIFKKTPRVLDLGCGNGHTLSVLKAEFPDLEGTGVEYSPDLLEIALGRNIQGIKFIHGDIRNLNLNESFDIIITERVLVNLLSPRQQHKATQEIKKVMNEHSWYLMIESFHQEWRNLNEIREEVKLDPIKISKHNLYLKNKLIRKMLNEGYQELEPVLPSNYLSTHFFLSRVFHPMIRGNGHRVNDSKIVQFFNKAFPVGIGEYSPILFRKFTLSTYLLRQ